MQENHKTEKLEQDVEKLKANIELLAKNIERKDQRWSRHLKRRHKLLYLLLLFLGIVLVWYSVWTIVSDTPFLRNEYVSGIIGLVILFVTGHLFDELV